MAAPNQNQALFIVTIAVFSGFGDAFLASNITCFDNTNTTYPVLQMNGCTSCSKFVANHPLVDSDSTGLVSLSCNNYDIFSSCSETSSWYLQYGLGGAYVQKTCKCCSDSCNSALFCSVANDSAVQSAAAKITAAGSSMDMSYPSDSNPISCYDGYANSASLKTNCSMCTKYRNSAVAKFKQSAFQCVPASEFAVCQPQLNMATDSLSNSDSGTCMCCSNNCNNDAFCSSLFGESNFVTGLSTTETPTSTTTTTTKTQVGVSSSSNSAGTLSGLVSSSAVALSQSANQNTVTNPSGSNEPMSSAGVTSTPAVSGKPDGTISTISTTPGASATGGSSSVSTTTTPSLKTGNGADIPSASTAATQNSAVTSNGAGEQQQQAASGNNNANVVMKRNNSVKINFNILTLTYCTILSLFKFWPY